MATEKQYDFFKTLYDEEIGRFKDLMDHAKTYISVITLFSGVLLLKGDDFKDYLSGPIAVRLPFLVGACLFVLALVGLLFAVSLRRYRPMADPEKVIAQLPDGALTDGPFLTDRIADLALATNANVQQNDRLAGWLQRSSWLLLLATVCMFVTLIERAI